MQSCRSVIRCIGGRASSFLNSSSKGREFSVSFTRYADVDIKTENGVKTLKLTRPAKKNALSTKMYLELAKSLYESNDDKSTKIVVITGSGDFFTAGNDIASLLESFQNNTPMMEYGHVKFITSLIDCTKPIVALVNGHAVGIGVTMLAHCESAFASDKATFNTPFIKLGIPPEAASSYLFPKIMGYAKAGEMLHFNGTLSAKEAYEYNLVSKVFPHAEFEKKAWEKIHQMADYPVESLVHSKELLRGRERDILRKVHFDEQSNINFEIVGKAVMKFLSKEK